MEVERERWVKGEANDDMGWTRLSGERLNLSMKLSLNFIVGEIWRFSFFLFSISLWLYCVIFQNVVGMQSATTQRQWQLHSQLSLERCLSTSWEELWYWSLHWAVSAYFMKHTRMKRDTRITQNLLQDRRAECWMHTNASWLISFISLIVGFHFKMCRISLLSR